jgi:aconitase B
MPKVILQISYDIDPKRREEYLTLSAEMKRHFTEARKKNYSIYEVKSRKNSFVEQFVCNSMEEYEALEDDLDETSENLVNKLELLKDGKAKYNTLVEID